MSFETMTISGFLNDGSRAAPRLAVFLNLGTLYDLRSDSMWFSGAEITLEQHLLADGFEGIQLISDEPYSAKTPLPYCGLNRVNTPAAVDAIVRQHAERGDLCLTLHAGWGMEDDDEVWRLVEAILAASERHQLPVFLETHRATITQDLWRTVQIAKRFPEVRFNGDFSHYYCGQELVYGDWKAKLTFMQPIFDRVGFLHGRIASPGCMQVPIGEDLTARPSQALGAADYLAHFKELWRTAMMGFLARAEAGDILIFAPELLSGNNYYARLFPDASGRNVEESDRYSQALLYAELARNCFTEAEKAHPDPHSRNVKGSMTSVKISGNQSINSIYVIFLGATAALGGMMFGFDIAIIVGAGPFLVQHFALSDLGLGWAYSSLLFGCVLGSVGAGRWTDRYGRQRLMLYVAALFFLTSIATGLAPTFTLFILARLLGGIAVGGVSVLSPMYVAEVAPPAIRGRMGATYQMSIAAGILLSYCINYGLRNAGEWNWRWMFLSGALPSAIFLAALWRAPETPRFLFQAGRKGDGRALLARIMNEDEAKAEAAEIEASLINSRNTSNLNHKSLRRVLAISFVLAVLIHVSGINTIIDYAPLILKSAGWRIDAALFSTFIIGGVNCVFTLISFWTIDRYGRKPLYLIGSTGMAAALVLLIGCFAAGQLNGALLLGLIGLFIAFFAACIGPVFWTLIPEIFPNGSRGKAMTVPVVTQWVANAVVVLLFPLAFHRLGMIPTFAFLASMCLFQALFTWRFVPETKGKTLEEIEQQWTRN